MPNRLTGGRVAALAAALAAACADPPAAANPRVASVRLRLAASTDAAAVGRQVDVTVFYARDGAERVTLVAQRFEVDTGVRLLPVTVDIGACLRDPRRAGATQGSCPVGATAVLRDGAGAPLDSATVGPVAVAASAGEAAALPTLVLRRTASIRLSTDSLRVHVGDTITVLGTAMDGAGAPLPTRPVAWSTADAQVVSVTARGGVTGMTVGSTTLTAEREGERATVRVTVPITGVQRWSPGERVGAFGRGDPLAGTVYAATARPGGEIHALSYFGQDVCRDAAAGWSCAPIPVVPGYNGAYVVSARSPTDVWIGGYAQVAKFDGTTLRVLPTGDETSYYTAIWAADDGNVFAAGPGGATARLAAGRWTTTPSRSTASPAYLYAMWGSSPTNVFAVGDSGALLRYRGGADWVRSRVPVTPAFATLRAVWGADSTHVYTVGDYGQVWMHNGATWTQLPSGGIWEGHSIHGTSATDVYVGAAVDSQYVLMRWDGRTWGRLAILPELPQSVYAVGDGRVLVSGPDGYVGVYQGGRVTTLSSYPTYTGLAVTSPTHAVIATGNAFWHFDGAAWSRMPSPWADPYFGSIVGLWASAPDDLFAAGAVRSQWHLFRFDGAAWRRIFSPANANLGAPWGVGRNDVIVPRRRWDGTLWHSDVLRCSTAGCQPIRPEAPGYLYAVWASSPTNVFAVGYTNAGGTVSYFTSRYDGRQWRDTPLGTSFVASSIWGVDSATVLLPSGRGVMRFDYASQSWQTLPGQSTGASAVWGTAHDDLYATSCGFVRRYDGRRWLSVPVPSDAKCVVRIAGLPTGGALATMYGARVLRGVGPAGTFGSGASASRALQALPGFVPDPAPRRAPPVDPWAAIAPWPGAPRIVRP
jgi:hypothetical protein